MKNVIEISTKNRLFIFKTNNDAVLKYFKRRGSISAFDFPFYCDGEIEDYKESSGGVVEWSKFNHFYELNAQNINYIKINGEDINEPIIKAAKKAGAVAKFPIIYQVQFIFDKKPDWVFNWYPTTGTLSKQKTTEKFYRMHHLGKYATVEEALEACK